MVKVGQQEGPPYLAELRLILEPGIAALGAARAKEEDVATMPRGPGGDGSRPERSRCRYRSRSGFPFALAEAAANPLILSLIDSIVGLLREQRMKLFNLEGGPQRGQIHHKRILEAAERRDPEMAGAAMRAHLEQVREDSKAPTGVPSSAHKKPAPAGSKATS
jgi:GntR family transcriptional repressor for pyruvate dehydrogenase complex